MRKRLLRPKSRPRVGEAIGVMVHGAGWRICLVQASKQEEGEWISTRPQLTASWDHVAGCFGRICGVSRVV